MHINIVGSGIFWKKSGKEKSDFSGLNRTHFRSNRIRGGRESTSWFQNYTGRIVRKNPKNHVEFHENETHR